MRELPIWISIIALIVSVASPYFEYKWNQKMNKNNLEAEYFRKIYSSFLMKEIPEARLFMHYNHNKLSDVDSLTQVLRKIRQESIYFKYNNRNFYDELLDKLQILEDDLVLSEGRDMDNDTYVEFYKRSEREIEAIYECITKQYLGEKSTKRRRLLKKR